MSSRSNPYRIPNPITRKWCVRTYLCSAHWTRFTSPRKLESVNGRCEGRDGTCTRPATEVHHLRYEHLFCEPNCDLIALCPDCHAWCHQVAANDNEHQLEFLFQPPKKEDAS